MTVATNRIEEVYRLHGRKLWRALVGFTSDPELASDALAEAFTQALARGDAIEDPERWIWRAAFRIAGGELKDRTRRLPATREPSLEVPDPLPHVIAALEHISPNQRLAVLLHDYADRPTDEIARILGSSRATVHVHLSQGRRRLRKLLEGHDA